MDKKQLTFGALAFLAGAGSVLVVDSKGKTSQVELIAETDPVEAPVAKGTTHDEIAQKIAKADAPDGKVVCTVVRQGTNHAFCVNGTAGFYLTEAVWSSLADEDTESLVLRDDKGDVRATKDGVAPSLSAVAE